jgi:hypothetical protein
MIHTGRVAPRAIPDLISACGSHQPPHKTTKLSELPLTFLPEGDGLGGVPSSETRVYLCFAQIKLIAICFRKSSLAK